MLFLLQQFLGIGLPAVLKQISEAQKQKNDAKTEQERIYAEEREKALEVKKEIILAAQGDRIERWMRVLFALPFIFYIWKLLLWDKIFNLGITDPLSPTLEYILWTVLGGYFLEATVKRFRA